MRGLSFSSSPGRRRAAAFVLTLIVEALFLLAFFVPFQTSRQQSEPSLTTISIRPAAQPAASQKKAAAKPKARSASQTPPPPTPAVAPDARTPAFVELSRKDFAAGDISKIPSSRGDGDTGTQTAGSAYGPGEGPNGAPLYNAEWYVEPTPGQLALYLPSGGPKPGWGLIMCQTAADYRVENCRSLSESPPGSRLASALRQAAWQFKVRPPRIGGKAIIGAWVRIRFDWTERSNHNCPVRSRATGVRAFDHPAAASLSAGSGLGP